MLQNAMFPYRRRVEKQDESGNPVISFNDNFINPLGVVSMFWEDKLLDNGDVVKMLNVFLANGFSVTFAETIGKRFVEHQENFLRAYVGAAPISAQNPTRTIKKTRTPISAEIVDEVDPSSTHWET